MTADGWISLAVIGFVLALLTRTRLATDVVLMAGLTLLILAGIVGPDEALGGFANSSVATVAVLYVVVAGLVDTGAVQALSTPLLGRPTTIAGAQARLMPPVAIASAFMNNTPLVAMMLPVVQEWSRRHRMAASKLLIPLSYAAVLGGTCTLIGTSTNLVVSGLVRQQTDLAPLGFFEIAWIGVPATLIGIVYILIAGRWLLPEHRRALLDESNRREYTIEMLVDPGSAVVGKTIEEAGLRHLPGAFLAELGRGASVIPAVGPNERLQAGDRLAFVGVVESVIDLVKLKGLVPVPDQLFKLDMPRPERRILEAVVSGTSPVVGTTIREGRFRSRYGAVVLAVARNGERLHGKVGDVVLAPGDTLLLEARPSFLEQHRTSLDFLLVSELERAAAPRHERAGAALAFLGAMVVAGALGFVSVFEAALVAAGLMLVARCTSVSRAREAVDWSVLVTIGASFGFGVALENSGAAAAVADVWLQLAGDNPWVTLAAVYVITMLVTELITNNAAAVLVFPLAMAAAAGLGVDQRPFVFAVMMAASASFATPIGYQCNTMVYGAGGYRFMDFVRFGLPLNIVVATVTIAIIPFVWHF
ncbi:MAG: SLC13 family permease [Gammaproteobacteria bacterium]|nr:SLC13 family permease [Gammaproteobacteria bacterium]